MPKRIDRTGAQRQAAYRARRKQAIAEALAAKGIPGPPALSTVPGERRWAVLREQARAALETVRDEMQAYVEDRSEEWQEGERAAGMQDRIDALESILAELEGLDR